MTAMLPNHPPNRLIESIGAASAGNLFAEKWLIAPNFRLGRQWLERVSLAGWPILNARGTTLFHLAQRLAAPRLSSLGKVTLSQHQRVALVDRVWSSLADSGVPYLLGLHPTWNLFEGVGAALNAFRMAGISSADLKPARFEVGTKGTEIRRILSAYEAELGTNGLADRAEVFRIAIEGLLADPNLLGPETWFLAPEDLDPIGLEKGFLEAIPETRKVALQVDPAWQGRSPLSIDFFQAAGGVNEVREVLRRVVSSGTRLDDVEILHTSREIYVPLLYETAKSLSENPDTVLPLTLEEGIPVSFTRPGKALGVWLRWISEGHPQQRLVELIREGYVRLPTSRPTGPGGDSESTAQDGFDDDWETAIGEAAALAESLEGVRIGFGLDRYLPKIETSIAALRRKEELPTHDSEGEISSGSSKRKTLLKGRIQDLQTLRNSLEPLLEISRPPTEAEDSASILRRAAVFIRRFAPSSGEEERYASKALIDRIIEFSSALPETGVRLNVDIWEWLADLPHSVRILGSRPCPGRLHVAPLSLGGHSGRPCTFLIGLDGGRLPGANLQDPILLDSERSCISESLPTSIGRFEKKIEDYWRLLGRLRGNATFSFSSREILEDREAFPSPLLVETYRRLTGSEAEDMSGFLESLPAPVSFTPLDLEASLDERDLLLSLLTNPDTPQDPWTLIREHYPHIVDGLRAQEGRESEELSAYDGVLSSEVLASARKPIGPFSKNGPVLSATALEEMGRCPLAYFFDRILGLSLPDDLVRDPGVWLNPLEAGLLLHEVFRDFIAILIEREEPVSFAKHESEIFNILDRAIQTYRLREPTPSEAAFLRQSEEFRLAVRLFLKEEEIQSGKTRPFRVEAGFGMESETDSRDLPVEIVLSETESIRLQGRIDRIDSGDEGDFSLWDYKSGGASKYKKDPPFNQGRIVQPFLYWAAVESFLKAELGSNSKVRSFGYFFPSEKGMTERVVYEADQLGEGREIVRDLCLLMEQGLFLPTDDKDDCGYCDFRAICGDVEQSAANSKAKLDNEANAVLDPMRRLRGKNAE